jgi:serine/threonine-protein kinase
MTYEMLTGMPPFTGRSAQAVLAAHVVEEPLPVERRRPAVPPALATLVQRCLAKRPADRPQAATEIMHVLDGLVTPSGTAPTTEVHPVSWSSVATPSIEQPARHRGWLVAGVAALLGLAVVGLLARRSGVEAPTERMPPARPAVESTGSVSGREAAGAPAPDTAPAKPAPDSATRLTPAAPPARPRASRTPDNRLNARSGRMAQAPAETTLTERTDSTVSPRESTPPAPPAAPPAPVPTEPSRAVPPTAVAAPDRRAPAPTPPTPPADPRPEIRAVVADYAAAVEAENLGDLRRIYPGMSGPQQRGWEQFFQLVRDVKAELSLARLDVSNGSAEAQVGGTYTYLNTSTQRTEHQPVSFRATLRRDGGSWRIVQVR